MKEQESKTYQQMLNEVESIVKNISEPDIDLDDMVTKVEKGYDLIQAMRNRLETTKERIETLHQQYNKEDSE